MEYVNQVRLPASDVSDYKRIHVMLNFNDSSENSIQCARTMANESRLAGRPAMIS